MRSLARRRGVWGLLILAVLAGAFVTPGCTRPPAGDQTGGDTAGTSGGNPPVAAERTLAVLSDPPGAEVLLDGAGVGTAPLRGLALSEADHTVTVREGGLVWEAAIPAWSKPSHVVFVKTDEPEAALFRSFSVRTTPAGAPVFVNGLEAGTGTLVVDAATAGALTLAAYAEGSLPQNAYIWPQLPGAPSHAYHFQLDPCAGNLAGPVETPGDLPVPCSTWPAPDHAVVQPAGDGTLLSADGLLATTLVSEPTESIVVHDLSRGPAGAGSGRILVSWRTRGIAQDIGRVPYAQGVLLVGWTGEGKLLFLAPEAGTGQSPAVLGVGLWEADPASLERRRLGWVPTWCVSRRLQRAWVTGDGRAVVVHTWDPVTSYFHVFDLASGQARVLEARLPVSDPGGCTIGQPSPDGWQVAYEPGPEPTTGGVRVLNLKEGADREVFHPGAGGYAGDLAWSPDGRFLAVACGDRGEPFAVVSGDDASWLYPSKFMVVSRAGERVAEVAVPGQTLGRSLGWSPDGGSVVVRTVSVTPLEALDEFGNTVRVTNAGRFYTGRPGEILAPATPADEDVSGYWSFGLLAADKLFLSGYVAERETVSLRDLATGDRFDFVGYRPAEAGDSRVRTDAEEQTLPGIILVPSGTPAVGEPAERPLRLLRTDGSFEDLPVSIAGWAWATPAGRRLACVSEAPSAGERRVDVILLPGD